jgi:hypothetical protein
MASKEKVLFELELPEVLSDLRFPPRLDERLHSVLDKQNEVGRLSPEEFEEAEYLVELSQLVSVLRMRAQRAERELVAA